jgi:hypothetical protein
MNSPTLKIRLTSFFMDQQSEQTHFMVRSKKLKGKIVVATTYKNLRNAGFSAKEIDMGYKERLLLQEAIYRSGSLVYAVCLNEAVEVQRESFLDKMSMILKTFFSRLKLK